MSSQTPPREAEIDFEQAARDYLARLPLEHFMEAIPQATQRKIFVVAGDLVHLQRPDIQAFSELLVQWRREGRRKPGQVVPDNMVVLWPGPIDAVTSYNLEKQPARPFWVLEYVSKGSKRKDYEENFDLYERELKVPYYLLFYPDNEELTLYRHNGEKYVTVTPNEHGRYPIPELEMEVGLLDARARFWFRSKLVPLPADLQRELDEAQRSLDEARKDRDEARKDRDDARKALQKANEEREKEQLAREALEQELQRLRSQLSRGEPPKQP
jgi:Uma2 family endonuclease